MQPCHAACPQFSLSHLSCGFYSCCAFSYMPAVSFSFLLPGSSLPTIPALPSCSALPLLYHHLSGSLLTFCTSFSCILDISIGTHSLFMLYILSYRSTCSVLPPHSCHILDYLSTLSPCLRFAAFNTPPLVLCLTSHVTSLLDQFSRFPWVPCGFSCTTYVWVLPHTADNITGLATTHRLPVSGIVVDLSCFLLLCAISYPFILSYSHCHF